MALLDKPKAWLKSLFGSKAEAPKAETPAAPAVEAPKAEAPAAPAAEAPKPAAPAAPAA